jgi:hypothetical protein
MRLYIQLGDVQLGYVAQVGILLLQKRLGARWFIPWAPWHALAKHPHSEEWELYRGTLW